MKGRANSAQNEWLQHPHVTWRTAFPLFTALWESTVALLRHERRLLVLTAAAMVAFTFGMVLVLAYFDPNGVENAWVRGGKTWSLVAVALVAVWTAVGRGQWHIRFLLGLLAAAWIAVAHVAAAHAMGVTSRAGIGGITTLAACTFALAAFGGAWLRSLGRCHLAGPGEDSAPVRLHLFQFSTATLFVMMMLTAAVLGLWQLAAGLEGLVRFDIRLLDNNEARGSILVASCSALAAYPIAYGDLKTAFTTTVVILVLLCVADSFAGSSFCPSFLRTIWSSFPQGALAGVVVSLGLALVPLVWLRLNGFHRQSVESGVRALGRAAEGA
jgi:hypothetical protein